MKKQFSEKQKQDRATYAREWRLKNPEKAASHAKKSRLKNQEKVQNRQRKWVKENEEHVKIKRKEYYENNKDRVKDGQLRRQFGITLTQYNQMLELQGGVCAICSGGPDAINKMLAVDHDHKNGKIRSLLCRGCNVGIGNLKDDPNLLEKAAKYIRDHS